MKDESNQEFKARTWVIPLLAMAVLVGFSALPGGQMSSEEKIIRARSKAEVLGYQVAQLYRESLASNAGGNLPISSRGPASVRGPDVTPNPPTIVEGLIGQDPWGHAYSYRIEQGADGKLKIQMRSPGPDGRPEDAVGDDVRLTLSL